VKAKHISVRVEQCLALAALSPCPRRQFGAMLIDPRTNSIIADGYNGTSRGSPFPFCGGWECEREGIESGTRLERGCHHAESNALANAARRGASTEGAWLIVSGEPCLMCSKILFHAGVKRVYCVQHGYAGGSDGVSFLRSNGVEVIYTSGPVDPRMEKQ
jgi:dCMP deaminase